MSETDSRSYRERVRDRVSNARDLRLGPMQSGRLTEGRHYTVLAYTDWADLFVPTVVQWAGSDQPDDLDDLERSKRLAAEAFQHVEGREL